MLVAANVTMQFGAKPLFDNVSVKFGDGNRYGLANGAATTPVTAAAMWWGLNYWASAVATAMAAV